MNGIFNINEFRKKDDTEKQSDKSQLLCSEFIDIHTQKIESLKQLAGRFPAENEIYFMWTSSSFNAFTFIPYMIKEFGMISELVLSTYSINRRIVDSLMRYIDNGKIKNVSILISDSIKYRIPRIYEHLEMLASHRKDIISIFYAWNHSKITLARSGSVHMIMEGSGNFSENAQYEQYIMTNSQKIYEFRRQCILGSITK
jgi:hypothetical protein